MSRLRVVAGALLLLFLAACGEPAWAVTAEEFFAQGVSAFKAGDYQVALDLFVTARAAGMERPTLLYNLGVCYYKLGRYTEAKEAFEATARSAPWAPLAYYNIGLSVYRLGDRKEAAQWFDRAWREAEDEKLRALALAMLERVEPERPRWLSEAGLDMGYDSNVALTSDEQVLSANQRSDSFTELSAFTRGYTNGSNGMRWDAGLYSLNYFNLTEFSNSNVLLGATKLATAGDWHAGLGADWQYFWLDGHGFERVATLRLEGWRALSEDSDLHLLYSAGHVDAIDSDFAFLQGSHQELKAFASQPVAGGRLHYGLTLERDRRADLETGGGEFFSYSPTRYAAWLNESWRLADHWQLVPGIEYQFSRYADPDRRASGLVETREDRLSQASLRLVRRINANWRLVGEYSYTDNNSNLPEFSFHRYLVAIGAVGRF